MSSPDHQYQDVDNMRMASVNSANAGEFYQENYRDMRVSSYKGDMLEINENEEYELRQ